MSQKKKKIIKGNYNGPESVEGKNLSPQQLSMTVEQEQARLGNHLVCLEMSTEVHLLAIFVIMQLFISY